MRREDLRLRQLAKAGDIEACLKLGEIYLRGSAAIAKNIHIGIYYLRLAIPKDHGRIASCFAKNLSLREIVDEDLIIFLKRAAEVDEIAKLKLSAWHFLRCEPDIGAYWLRRCNVKLIEQSEINIPQELSIGRILDSLQAIQVLDPGDVSCIVASEARSELDENRLDVSIKIISTLSKVRLSVSPDLALHQLICDIVAYAEKYKHDLGSLPTSLIEQSLERCSTNGDLNACHLLGRSLAGYPCGHLPANRLVRSQNLRKSVALLLRCGDAGMPIAWLHLFRICSDYRSSVANPTMARFCLEKAAKQGSAEAERCLGIIILRESFDVGTMANGIKLLHSSAGKGDSFAKALLSSFVLPVIGQEEEAQAVISEIHRVSPVLAMRLRLARAFGLTKLEALSMNIAVIIRPWGLVLERNILIAKRKLSEPRAIPAINSYAMSCLDMASNLYLSKSQDSTIYEGSFRARSLQLRRLLQKTKVQEKIFFSTASSQERDAIRVGSKWAKMQKDTLNAAFLDQSFFEANNCN